MFTGITTHFGHIRSLNGKNKFSVEIETNMKLTDIELGSSIMCSGICLTVINKGENYFRVDISEETLKKTTAEKWKIGEKINLEKSLKVGDELGGHFVYGHVDEKIKLEYRKKLKGSVLLEFSVSKNIYKYICPKGSVAIDGVSLTVNDVSKNSFFVNIVPHTVINTTLGLIKSGNFANIEIDMLARYVKS